MDYWANAPLGRDQMVLFSPTLDAMIDTAHPVRLLDENWHEWEAPYDGRRGQPPLHPRVVASVLLYGLTRGLRSSRQLEFVCTHNIDFMWLAEGRSIDHSTLAFLWAWSTSKFGLARPKITAAPRRPARKLCRRRKASVG